MRFENSHSSAKYTKIDCFKNTSPMMISIINYCHLLNTRSNPACKFTSFWHAEMQEFPDQITI